VLGRRSRRRRLNVRGVTLLQRGDAGLKLLHQSTQILHLGAEGRIGVICRLSEGWEREKGCRQDTKK
jgi:hypothetical protein